MTLIAINVLLEPDAATVEKAKAINARLRENYPASFPLDANHAPHITILQLFINTVDLGQVAAAVGNVLRSEPPINIEGKATGYFELASENLKLVGFHIEATPYQHQLQQKIIAATAPFAVKYGTSDAFAPRLEGEPISQATIDYVTNFGDTQTGPNYQPHLTLGIGTSDFVEALAAEPFETFSFQTASISLYQIGDYGVAQTKLYDLSCQVDPLPFQAAFAIDELKLRILTEPSLTSNPMVQAALDGDLAKLLEGEHCDGLMQILVITHAGMTVEEF